MRSLHNVQKFQENLEKPRRGVSHLFRKGFAFISHSTPVPTSVSVQAQVKDLDPDVQVPDPELLPAENHKIWTGFEDCELVQWLKTQVSGHCGTPKLGFRLKKFWLLARYLHIFEQKRCLFTSNDKLDEAFLEVFNDKGGGS